MVDEYGVDGGGRSSGTGGAPYLDTRTLELLNYLSMVQSKGAKKFTFPQLQDVMPASVDYGTVGQDLLYKPLADYWDAATGVQADLPWIFNKAGEGGENPSGEELARVSRYKSAADQLAHNIMNQIQQGADPNDILADLRRGKSTYVTFDKEQNLADDSKLTPGAYDLIEQGLKGLASESARVRSQNAGKLQQAYAFLQMQGLNTEPLLRNTQLALAQDAVQNWQRGAMSRYQQAKTQAGMSDAQVDRSISPDLRLQAAQRILRFADPQKQNPFG